MSIDPRIVEAFATIFPAELVATLTPDSSMETVPGWDSTSYVQLVIALEDRFGIHFSALEATRMQSVREIERVLVEKGMHLRTGP